MDDAGLAATRLLEALQLAREGLLPVRAALLTRGATATAGPTITLSGRPLRIQSGAAAAAYQGSAAVVLQATARDGRGLDFCVELLWDAARFTITTEVWIDSPRNQDLLFEAPPRRADSLEAALRELSAAVASAAGLVELLPAP